MELVDRNGQPFRRQDFDTTGVEVLLLKFHDMKEVLHMALWNRGQPQPKSKKEIKVWEYAHKITKAEAQSDDLPLGWYYYQDGYIWYALKPDEKKEKLIRSFSQRTPQELVDWLGIPIEETITEGRPSEEPSTELKSERRMEAVNSEHSDVSESIDLDLNNTKTPRRKASGRSRPNELHFWFSDEELRIFKRRVEHSGLTQSDFIRRVALTGRIVIEERGTGSIALLDELELLRAEIGRQGGLLKMVVKPNLGQRELAPEEWQELVQAIRHIEHLTKKLSDLQERL